MAVSGKVLAKITQLEAKSAHEVMLEKYYVVDYAGGWSTSNQIIQMGLKEMYLEVSLFNL